MASGKPQHVGRLLSAVLGQVASRTGSGAALGQVWLAAVGPAVGHNAHPESLVQGVLTVRCDGPAWKDALVAQRAEILNKLTAQLGPAVVTALRFTVT